MWAGLKGPHVVVTMSADRAVQLAGTLSRSDALDSAEVAELVQLLSRAAAERDALVRSAPRRFFGTLPRGRWIATPPSSAPAQAPREPQLVNDGNIVADSTIQTPAPADSHQALETINPFVVDAWSSTSHRGARGPDIPTIHVSASGARTAAILGARSVDIPESTDGIHDVSAEFTADEKAGRLEAAARVANVVATTAGQAAIVAIASQSALETATQAREAATEASRAAAAAAAASIKFEHVVKEAAEAAQVGAPEASGPVAMHAPATPA